VRKRERTRVYRTNYFLSLGLENKRKEGRPSMQHKQKGCPVEAAVGSMEIGTPKKMNE
jgi:hypothetical protein